jgi:hypothetical protein
MIGEQTVIYAVSALIPPHTNRCSTAPTFAGSKTASRFRSPAEFFFHAKWLADGMPVTSSGASECECTYCDRSRTQGEISTVYSNYTKSKRKRGGDDQKKGGEDVLGKRVRDGKESAAKKRSKIETSKPIMAKDYRDMSHIDSGSTSN